MNWYKVSKLTTAQRQQLMFYPWQKYDQETGQTVPYNVHNVPQRLQPMYSNPMTGENFYRCVVCNEDIPESDIAIDEDTDEQIWFRHPNQETWLPYEYPETINQEQLLKEVENIYNSLYKTYENFLAGKEPKEKSYRFDYEEVPIPDVKSAFYASEEVQKYCSMKSSIGKQEYLHWRRDNICDFGQHDHSIISLDELRRLVANPQSIEANIQKTLNNIPKQQFSVPMEYPICEDCYEEAERCEHCGKKMFDWEGVDKEHILDPKHNPYAYPTVGNHNEYVCGECIDSGYADICKECGYVDSTEEMYSMQDGMMCKDCLENYSDVENWRDQIDEAASYCEFPFQHWFPEDENRIYFPFVSDNKISSEDGKVISFLRSRGCELNDLDYQYGQCFYKGRSVPRKIGKLLKSTFSMEDRQQGVSTPEKEQGYDDLLRIFETSKYRKLKDSSDLMVVISQDPDDIAGMSTGRNWISCMHLGRERGYDVFNIIEAGSLIAYLIRKNDKEVEEPLARITIRRYENEQENSLAVPEEGHYGTAPSGFYEAVKNWLQSKQRDLPPGEYKRVENAHSDTLGLYHEKVAKLIAKLRKSGMPWYKVLKIAEKKLYTYELV